jgi:hypothetical protein
MAKKTKTTTTDQPGWKAEAVAKIVADSKKAVSKKARTAKTMAEAKAIPPDELPDTPAIRPPAGKEAAPVEEHNPDLPSARAVVRGRADKLDQSGLPDIPEDQRPDYYQMDVLLNAWLEGQKHSKSLDPETAKAHADCYYHALATGKRAQVDFLNNPKLQAEFLYVYERLGFIQTTCDIVGTNPQAVRNARINNPIFAALFEEAFQRYNDGIVKEVHRRAVEGVERPMIYDGKLVKDEDGFVVKERHYSDQLLMKLWQYRDPTVMDKTLVSVERKGSQFDEGGKFDMKKLTYEQRQLFMKFVESLADKPSPIDHEGATDLEVADDEGRK